MLLEVPGNTTVSESCMLALVLGSGGLESVNDLYRELSVNFRCCKAFFRIT